MRPISLSRQLAAASANNICLSQGLGGAGNLVLNGALVTAGIATLDVQRKVAITSAGNDAAVVFTLTGTDQNGNVITETLTGVNANTVSSLLDYLTVTTIRGSAATAANVTVGTTGVGASQPVPMDTYANPTNISVTARFGASVANATVQYTFEDIYGPSFPSNAAAVWYSHPNITAVAGDTTGTIVAPVTAIRLLTNSGTDPVTLQLHQAGSTGGA